MPLKLWLPLDGTSENRGISGLTMSGSPASWGNGRTGKCAVFNDNTSNCIYYDTTEFNYAVEDFSWCMWLKRDQSAMTATAMFAFSVGRPDYGDNRGYGLAVHTANTLRFWFGYSNYDVTGFPNNEWHHVAFTRKGNTLKLYLDGVLKSTKTYTGATPTFSSYGPGIGCFHYSSNIYPLIGAISDFRIYNHTLSDKEVYELSRGLILHYPLSAPGNANPNLLTWTKNYTEATPLVHTSSAKDGYKYLGDDSLITVTPGKTYYVQLKSDGTLSASHASGAGVVSDKFTFWFYIRNTGTSKNVGQYDQTVCFTSAISGILVNDPDRQLYVWKWTAPSNAQDITLRTNSYSDGSTAVTLHFWDIKIEEETYTSYVPSRNSAQYAELGYGSGIVRDATGRGNDLSTVGTPVFSNESIRYATAINFNKAGYLKLSPCTMSLSTLSVSFWFNAKDTTGSTQHFLFGSFASWPNEGLGIYRDIGKNYFNIVFRTAGAETTYCSCGGQTFSYNEWHHMAFTWDGTTVKIYLDNALKTTKTYGQSGTCEWKNIFLGNSAYNSTPASETEDCRMSDFRIYGTALSADDVAYLYKTSAAIDNNGDMFAESFEETELKPRVGSEGLVYGSHLTESGGTICSTLVNSTNNYDPNTRKWSYIPAADTDNSCMDFATLNVMDGVSTYHISMIVEWSGFADITTTHPSFSTNFHGILRGRDGTNSWNTNPVTTALNGISNWNNMVKGAASGVYKYEATITLTSSFMETYKGCDVGFRTNYSNGTGKITASKLRIYPADEHMTNSASLCSSGAIQVRLADEVSLA